MNLPHPYHLGGCSVVMHFRYQIYKVVLIDVSYKSVSYLHKKASSLCSVELRMWFQAYGRFYLPCDKEKALSVIMW